MNREHQNGIPLDPKYANDQNQKADIFLYSNTKMNIWSIFNWISFTEKCRLFNLMIILRSFRSRKDHTKTPHILRHQNWITNIFSLDLPKSHVFLFSILKLNTNVFTLRCKLNSFQFSNFVSNFALVTRAFCVFSCLMQWAVSNK